MAGPAQPAIRRRLIAAARGAVAAVLLLTTQSPAPVAAQDGGISLIRDAEIEAILKRQAEPIFRAAKLNPDAVHIYIVNDRELNAFVAGGQNMFLNTGLIMKAKTPNELLGVIAHETGHMAGGHLVRSDEGMRAALATQFITMGVGLAAAFAGGDARGAAVIMASAGQFATLQLFTFTRVQESAADQAAVGYMEASGQSAIGLVDFFKNFQYQELFSDPERKDAFFRSHPLTSDRMEALRGSVARQPHYATKDTPQALADHATMLAKLRGFINYPIETYTAYPETDTSFTARYARAMAAYKEIETEKALTALDDLNKEQPNNPFVLELKGQVLFERGRVREAVEPFRRASALAPNEALIHMALGQALLANRNRESVREALEQLIRTVNLEPENGTAWKFLADAYEQNSQPAMARLATAEGTFFQGNMIDARNFARQAMERLTKDTPEYRRAEDIALAAEISVERAMRGGRGG